MPLARSLLRQWRDGLRSPAAGRLLDKIFDALFFRGSLKRKIRAEAREAEARARRTEAQTRVLNARADRALVKVRREETMLLLDYSVALDSLAMSLRNAGFDNAQIQRTVMGQLQGDINTLALHKSLGLITSVESRQISEGSRRRNPK
jgi:hypothetical protein